MSGWWKWLRLQRAKGLNPFYSPTLVVKESIKVIRSAEIAFHLAEANMHEAEANMHRARAERLRRKA